ncbi:MAG: rhodanese-like domain-containing protein [Luteolibacter sp.]
MQANDLSGESSMESILQTLPGARRALFARYHLGGCQSCAYSNQETLAELCHRAELDVNEVLEHLMQSHQHDIGMLMEPTAAHESRAEIRFIDTRTREEYEAVRIDGADFLTQDLQNSLFADDSNPCLLLYDHRGIDILDRVAWFRGHGLQQCFGLRGGIDAWSQEIDPKLPRYRLEID